jgi:hypothetical protein
VLDHAGRFDLPQASIRAHIFETRIADPEMMGDFVA